MPRVEGTESFRFNHTMIRVKDAKASIKWYTEVLGMEVIDKMEGGDFTLYFLAFDDGKSLSPEEKTLTRFKREGVLEMTYNHGTDTDPNFKGYASGNSEPGRGFGHIAISVDDIDAACARFERLGVKWQKRLTDGRMKNIAFILDPDGYWVEVVPTTYHGF